MRISAGVLLCVSPIVAVLTCVPAGAATITVTTNLDADAADGFCSLREAILAANDDAAHNECPAGSGADRIVFSLALPATITVSSDLPAVTDTVAIRGPGAGQLAIDGATLHRLFDFASPAGGKWYLLEDLTVQHGYSFTGLAPDGGGVYVGPGEAAVLSRLVVTANVAANGGGGIVVDGLLDATTSAEIIDCAILDNIALGASGGGGLMVFDGSTVTVDRSSIVGNRAQASSGVGGGIVDQRSYVTVLHSTISGNAANGSGGGIFVSASGGAASLTLDESTVFENQADADGDLVGDTGGIHTCCAAVSPVSIELHDSIVAGNLDDGPIVQPDLAGGTGITIVSSGFNLIGANDGAVAEFPAGSPNANGDFVGTAASPVDPMLLPLDLNQGITPSHRPILDPASLIIDHGSCPGSVGDQRGSGAPALHRRAYDHPAVPNLTTSDGCDIGAVERGANANSARELFRDGFELGHTLRWSAEAP